MTLPKVRSFSYLSLAGVVLLVGGLGVAVLGAQQQQDQRSEASGARVQIKCEGRKVIVGTNSPKDLSSTIANLYCDYNYDEGGNAERFLDISCIRSGTQYVGRYYDCDDAYQYQQNRADCRVKNQPLQAYEKRACDFYYPTNAPSCNARGGYCASNSCPSNEVHLSGRDASCQVSSVIGNTCCIAEAKLKLDAPTLRTTGSSDTTVTLAWNSVGNKYNWLHPEPGDVTGYFIYRNGQLVVPNETITGTTYQDTGLTSNTTYRYQVKAIAFPATYSSDLSTVLPAKTLPPGANPQDGDPDDGVPPGSTSGDAPYGVGCGSAGCCARDLGGTCQYTSNNCPGDYATNYCDKGSNYKCCKNLGPTATAGEDQSITLPVTRVTLNGSGTDPENGALRFAWTKTSGPDGGVIVNPNAAQTEVTGLETAGAYTFNLQVTDIKGVTKEDVVTITVNPQLATTTMFEFDVVLNGIGNSNQSGENQDPDHKTRTVKIEIRDINDESLILAKEGEVTYDSASGSYKGEVEIDSRLTNGETYKIWVKLSHSLWNKNTTRNITLGQTYSIPQLTLKNGDVNNDGYVNSADYNIIRDCYFDPDIRTPAKNCNDEKKEQADINDDGEVHHLDLSLFLSEMSIQH